MLRKAEVALLSPEGCRSYNPKFDGDRLASATMRQHHRSEYSLARMIS